MRVINNTATAKKLFQACLWSMPVISSFILHTSIVYTKIICSRLKVASWNSTASACMYLHPIYEIWEYWNSRIVWSNKVWVMVVMKGHRINSSEKFIAKLSGHHKNCLFYIFYVFVQLCNWKMHRPLCLIVWKKNKSWWWKTIWKLNVYCNKRKKNIPLRLRQLKSVIFDDLTFHFSAHSYS